MLPEAARQRRIHYLYFYCCSKRIFLSDSLIVCIIGEYCYSRFLQATQHCLVLCFTCDLKMKKQVKLLCVISFEAGGLKSMGEGNDLLHEQV